MDYFDRYTPDGLYTVYERDEYDPHGDDRLRLYWDNPAFPGQWSLTFSWTSILPSDPPTSEMITWSENPWPRDALLRNFELGNRANEFPFKTLAFSSPVKLSNGRERERLVPQTWEFVQQTPLIGACVQDANEEMMRWLAKHPENLYRVHPGTFERIIAEIFRSQGYEVELLGQWNQPDGGIDVIAVLRNTPAGEYRIGIQCKRYVKTQVVKADIVWALLGRLQKFHLHKGVIATTAHFEQSLLKEVHEHLWQIDLKDFKGLRDELETWNRSVALCKEVSGWRDEEGRKDAPLP